MDKHLHMAIVAKVIARRTVDGPGVATGQTVHIEGNTLLVELSVTVAAGVPLLPFNSRREHIRHGVATAVFLNIHRGNIESGILARTCGVVARLEEVLRVFAPSGVDEVQSGKTQYHRFLKLVQEHSHESD